MTETGVRLTALAHGGGCGCKLAPAVLQELLAHMPLAVPCPNLLVGNETADDAAVYRLNEQQALVATTDFFTPIVDDPFDFGRIAAANALSDVYAMGGAPILALALVGMPVGKIAPEVVGRILAGGASVCAAAGIPVAGGHSIDSPEPIYGLVALGIVRPDRVLRNASARPGDRLVLTKGLGVGIFSAALKRDALPPGGYETMLASTTQLNRAGQLLPEIPGVHAVTDVTGFALLGHALEMARGSGLAALIHMKDVPVLSGAAALAEAGVQTGAGARNWASCRAAVTMPADISVWQHALLCDPQTSGGLLISVRPEDASNLLKMLHREGYAMAAVIGEMQEGAASVTVC